MARSKQTIAVHITPRSGRDEVMGLKAAAGDVGAEEYEVAVRVTAPPEGGKANKAVCAVVARALGVPRSSVSVVRGQQSRHKLLAVAAGSVDVPAWLESLPKL